MLVTRNETAVSQTPCSSLAYIQEIDSRRYLNYDKTLAVSDRALARQSSLHLSLLVLESNCDADSLAFSQEWQRDMAKSGMANSNPMNDYFIFKITCQTSVSDKVDLFYVFKSLVPYLYGRTKSG